MRPNVMYCWGTEYATAFVIPSYHDRAQHNQRASATTVLTNVSRFGFAATASWNQFAPAIVFARSAPEFPSSSLMFTAACLIVCEPGLPDTELAAPRTSNWPRRRLEGALRGATGEAKGRARGRLAGEENGRLNAKGARARAAVVLIIVYITQRGSMQREGSGAASLLARVYNPARAHGLTGFSRVLEPRARPAHNLSWS